MRMTRREKSLWVAVSVLVAIATWLIIRAVTNPTAAEEKNSALPATYEIVQNGNLYDATVALCGSVNAADKEGRGRWRRWRNADARIAVASMHRSRAWGWVITIQPGTYKVPSDLCEDETNNGWLGWIFVIFLGLVFLVLLVRVLRGGRPRVVTAHARS